MTQLKFIIILIFIVAASACSQPDKPELSFTVALQNRDINQIERHIYWGTDLNQVLPNGLSPIQFASQQGHIIVVKLLLKQNIQIETKTSQGHTSLYLAILNGRTQIADLLVSKGANIKADQYLLNVVNENITDKDIIGYLVDHGANTEIKDAEGNTPLLIAVSNNNYPLVKFLTKAGAKIIHRNKLDQSALDIANKMQYSEIQKFLIRNGANLTK